MAINIICFVFSRFHQGCCRFWGSASEYLSWDAPAEQDLEGDQEEHCQEVYGTLPRTLRGQGKLQEVIRTILKEPQGKTDVC